MVLLSLMGVTALAAAIGGACGWRLGGPVAAVAVVGALHLFVARVVDPGGAGWWESFLIYGAVAACAAAAGCAANATVRAAR